MDFFGDLDRVDNRGYTPLHYAADHSLLENVRLLLGYGAEPDVKSSMKGHEVRVSGSSHSLCVKSETKNYLVLT